MFVLLPNLAQLDGEQVPSRRTALSSIRLSEIAHQRSSFRNERVCFEW